jgi:hypothetical protein
LIQSPRCSAPLVVACTFTAFLAIAQQMAHLVDEQARLFDGVPATQSSL